MVNNSYSLERAECNMVRIKELSLFVFSEKFAAELQAAKRTSAEL